MKTRTSLKFLTLALAAVSFASLGHNAYAAGGIFGSDDGLQLNGGAFTFYENSLQGDGRHNPLVSGGVTAAPTLVTTGLPASLGTFNPFAGDTLFLIGGEALTFKNGSTDVTGAFVNYSIDGGSFSSISLTFNEDNVNGNGGDQRWANTNFSIDLLAGQSLGTHTLSFYVSATTNGSRCRSSRLRQCRRRELQHQLHRRAGTEHLGDDAGRPGRARRRAAPPPPPRLGTWPNDPRDLAFRRPHGIFSCGLFLSAESAALFLINS